MKFLLQWLVVKVRLFYSV